MDTKLFQIGGVSAIVAILGAVVYFIAVGPFMPPPNAPADEVLRNLARAPQAILWFGWEGVVLDILLFPVGLALYFALREDDPTYALLGLVALMFGHVWVIYNDARLPTISWGLAQAYATGDPAKQAAALVVMESLDKWVSMTTAFVAGLMAGAGYGFFGLAQLASRWFPRWLGLLGVAGGVLMMVGGVVSPFLEAGMMIVLASFLPNFAWIFIGGIYLLRVRPTGAASPETALAASSTA